VQLLRRNEGDRVGASVADRRPAPLAWLYASFADGIGGGVHVDAETARAREGHGA
jgi:hypothetical protein